MPTCDWFQLYIEWAHLKQGQLPWVACFLQSATNWRMDWQTNKAAYRVARKRLKIYKDHLIFFIKGMKRERLGPHNVMSLSVKLTQACLHEQFLRDIATDDGWWNVNQQVCIHEISRLPARLCPPTKALRTDQPTDRQTDRQTDQRTDRRTDGWTHPLIESWLTTNKNNRIIE